MNGTSRQLDPRWVSVQRLAGWVMFVILMSVWAASVTLAWGLDDIPRWFDLAVTAIGAVLAPLLIWLAIAWPAISYRHFSYSIDDHGIEIRSGVVFRSIVHVPRSRVQHTDVAQGPIERRFGLGTLVIYTAGTQFARVDLPGLEYGMAMWTRDMLLPTSGADAV